jgi:hypothetical protein
MLFFGTAEYSTKSKQRHAQQLEGTCLDSNIYKDRKKFISPG